MYSSNKNIGFPVTIIYFTKNRLLYKDKSFSKNTFNSILENYKKNPVYKSEAKLKNNYLLNGREIRNNQLLEELINQNEPQSLSTIKEAEISLELEDLVYTGDSTYQCYQKIIQPKFNPFGLYIYSPKEGTICSYTYPEKTINLFELNKINEGSAYCNSYNDLYISGSNEYNNKDFLIINNSNYEIKKKNMPTNKNNHSMIFLNFNKNEQWIFIVGGNDKKTFYYDLKKNYFINWGDTNEIYTKPALIHIGEYLYIFDPINYRKNFIERTKLINPNRKWEKLMINIDKKKIYYFPSKFGLSFDSNGKVLLIGGDNNKMNNTFVYEPSNKTFTLSQNGTNDNVVLDDKSFYKINNNYSVGLPHNLNETKEIYVVDKDDQSLIKINIEFPKDNNKAKVVSNLSFNENPSINNDKGSVEIKTTKEEIKPPLFNKQQPYAQSNNNPLLCDNCLNSNRDTFICQCCHNPFQRMSVNNYNRMSENVDNPTKENPRITIVQDEYYPLGSMNFQSYNKNDNNNYRKVYNKNYNRARDKAKVEIIYDEYTPIKVDYELNKEPGSIKKFTYVKKFEEQKKNDEEKKDEKNEEIIENIVQNDAQKEVKENKILENEEKDKDNKDNENNENEVVEYKNNEQEQENKDDDLFAKSQNENENEEEENQNEIIIEENHNNEDGEEHIENNVDGEEKEKLGEMDEEENKEKIENGEKNHENIEEDNKGQDINEGGNNIPSQNKEIINGELPKDSLEFKDVVKNEINNNNGEHKDEVVENNDNCLIREGEEFHSMEEDNGEEQKNSVEQEPDNENNAEIYENGNEIKFDGENDNDGEENGEHNNDEVVQIEGEENGEEGNFEEGGEEEMNYQNEEGEGEGEGEEGMNDGDIAEGSMVENDLGNENEEQNSVIEIKHDEDENGGGEGEGEGEGEEEKMNFKDEEQN